MCISSGSTRLTEAKDWPRALYERFFEAARGHGRSLVRSVTSPTNLGSIEFHRRLGFEIEGEAANHDGEGSARVLFVKSI
jgi:predicted GNAT superfamily acetyltransferase